MIIMVIGKACVGKTYFREYVSKKDSVITYEASDYIKEAKYKFKTESTRKLLDEVGDDYAAREIYSAIKNSNVSDKDIVISGFRTLEEIDYISGKIDKKDIRIIVIEANNLLCYIRNLKRNRNDSQKSYRGFIERQQKDEELGYREIIRKYSSVCIRNNLTKRKFESSIDKYMRILMREKTKRKNNIREKLRVRVDNIRISENKDNISEIGEYFDER